MRLIKSYHCLSLLKRTKPVENLTDIWDSVNLKFRRFANTASSHLKLKHFQLAAVVRLALTTHTKQGLKT